MLKIKLKNKLFKFKTTKLEDMGSPRYFRFELILFKRYRIVVLEIGKNPSHKKLYWIEFRLCGFGVDYNIETETNKRWFFSCYDKFWKRA